MAGERATGAVSDPIDRQVRTRTQPGEQTVEMYVGSMQKLHRRD
jgi:hypothetical protein